MSKRASMTAQQIECRSALYGDVCQLRGESIEGLGVEIFCRAASAGRLFGGPNGRSCHHRRSGRGPNRLPGHGPRQVVILEAGCGSASEVVLPFEKRIVGIDIDAEQLKHNDAVEQKIQGDLQTYDLPQNAFDLVTCVDVLEHLQFPEKALANMFRSVSPEDTWVAGPEPYSYKGLVAQYTPHSMRFVIHKLITGIDAPEIRRTHGNGQVFFPTYLKPACSLKNLVGAAQRCGLEVVYEKAFDVHSSMIRAAYKPFLVAVNLFARWVEALSAGRINLLLADYVLLLKKVERSAKLSMLSGGSIPTMSVSER